MSRSSTPGIWDASECALVLIDYQAEVLEAVFEQDQREIEFNVCALAKAAKAFNIPIVLSTVGVQLGVSSPTLPALRAIIPDVEEIDRSSMDAWDDLAFVDAVKATGRKKLVMGGLVTSGCLAFAAVEAIADGFEVAFAEDAVGDRFQKVHDIAVLRLVQAGAVPNSTLPVIAEWFRDWKSPSGEYGQKAFVEYLDGIAPIKSKPEYQTPIGPSEKKRSSTV